MTNFNSVHYRKILDMAPFLPYIFAGEINTELQSDSAESYVSIYTLCRIRDLHLQEDIKIFHLIIVL